jgi:hypothetical protein
MVDKNSDNDSGEQPVDFDDMPTRPEMVLTMAELVFGEGYLPIGPDRPTRRMRPLTLEQVSDGVPEPIDPEDDPTSPFTRVA